MHIPIEPHLGIIYSECSRIWNPIHSDPSTATASGLGGGPILHGTATLAKCVSALVRRFTAGNDPAAVQRVSVKQFGAPVTMPTVLTLEVSNVVAHALSSLAVHFMVKTSGGDLAVRGGCVVLRAISARPSSILLRTNDPVIRPIDPTDDLDLAAVRALFAAGMRFYSDRMPPGSPLRVFWEAYIANALGDDLADIAGVYLKPGGAFWVVVVEEEIVGMVAVEVVDRDKGIMELRRMSVSPDMKHRGLGSRLVRLVEDFAALHGGRELVLTTGSLMAPARALYARNGFEAYRVEPRTSAAMRGAGQTFSIVHFRKPVTSPRGRWVWTPARKSRL
jgi:GNAT superfamily N-acetyltransferase/acyl dehydratase